MSEAPPPQKAVPEKAVAFLEKHGCLFQQPWWLDAVCVTPWRWSCAWVERGDEVAAAWPVPYKVILGRRVIEPPDWTAYLGPVLRPSVAKSAVRLGEEKDLITELASKLPSFATFQQHFAPTSGNWLPLYWLGFRQTTHYTYVIPSGRDPESCWKETRDNVRSDVRKAEKLVQVREGEDFQRVIALHKLTLSRQAKTFGHSEALLSRLDAHCAARGRRKILLAVDPEGREHAAVYLVWDDRTVYYLCGGGDPALRKSGAGSLLVWEAIKFACASGRAFDFEGSMVEPIERFFRSFGAVQTPYFVIRKTASRGFSFARSMVRVLKRQWSDS
ncbi:MAG: GNAT family N-acetyltransferase [Verrucomicrobiae bacterium]|nr:GNAT family N-acetyltransferase [Verrucomicrobiae bacterium]